MKKGETKKAVYCYMAKILEPLVPWSFPIMMIMAAYADYKGWSGDDLTSSNE